VSYFFGPHCKNDRLYKLVQSPKEKRPMCVVLRHTPSVFYYPFERAAVCTWVTEAGRCERV